MIKSIFKYKSIIYSFITIVFFGLFLQMSFAQGAPSNTFPDLQFFKITYPLDDNGNDYTGVSYSNRSNPFIESYEVDNLNGYNPSSTYSNYFFVSGSELVFKAHCAGALTSPNAYPRCELRERVNGSNDLWLFNDEQELNTTFRITNLPNQKQEVCMLQIKGNDCNCTSGTEEALRLEYRQDGSQGFHATINENTTLTDIMDYSLGETVESRLYINNNIITVELNNIDVSGPNGEWTYTYTSNYSHGYFKAGCYTQSSIWVEKNGVANELPTAYGEVVFTELILGADPNAGGNNSTTVCTPMVPNNIGVTILSSTSANLYWDHIPNYDHYNVRYRKVGTSTWNFFYSLQVDNITATGLQANEDYEWQIRAKCPDGSSLSYNDGQGPDFNTNTFSAGVVDTVVVVDTIFINVDTTIVIVDTTYVYTDTTIYVVDTNYIFTDTTVVINNPNAGLPANPQFSIASGDFYAEDSSFGTVYTSPNGSCFRLKVSDNGELIVESVACP